ncbi:dihydrofolate synthase/folylpolyglutamate synthase [Pullulanibacillus pueri]|uniref:Dihydrofolate synthase/folylpolyglutamate synthase n=1 Tax=Pullulanibacillus pueri TaxID=1437324 RepID=A0A8J3A001_9BACL|nr:folylpolyglutamate synthase/dihydrofolate synthase family protein [Pullulanibacillus pueri]MBM7681904.1 dihydrofolate synthase/folylpolyglutamate synthase [Pullulanibacillus pueri]GGH89080.1 bifunctional folylpolyglutamate synthase/dihydrofolate synthase [Pullulanibacillus pueri]
MFQTLNEVEAWTKKWLPFGLKLGLERMEWLLEQLDHPERRLRVIHVGGTNGKGSTVSYINSILTEAGYDVGMFTSPALRTFNDRIVSSGKPIADDELIKTAEIVKPFVEALEQTEFGAPTEFEVITIMAIVYFAKVHPCDLVLFEVGLGGRYDSTNVVHPLLTIITNIGHDHMKQLGNTLKEIAYEKAGIIKQGVPLVTAAEGEAFEVIATVARQCQAKVYHYGHTFKSESDSPVTLGESFSIRTPHHHYQKIKLAMSGHHQVVNASLAIMAAEYLQMFYAFDIKEDEMKSGLEKAFWAGRFEKLSDAPLTILDGAHNLEGMEALVQTIQAHYPEHEVITLFATLKDKDNVAILKTLGRISKRIVVTGFENERAMAPQDVLPFIPDEIQGEVIDSWESALTSLQKEIKGKRLLLITGSLYFVTQVRAFYLSKN